MDNNNNFSHLNLPIDKKEVLPVDNMVQSIRKSVDTSNKKQGEFFVSFDDINNRGVDNRIKTFDNTTPFLDVYQPLNSGEVVAKYETFTPGIDNNEYLAQNQSGWEQTVNGLEKAGANIGSVVLGNTAGFVYGLADWAKTGNFSSVYDNSFSKTLDDWNTKLNYQLPNYYTKQEKEAGFLGSLSSANFWANDVANGLSFTLGTIASEAIWAYATGGASLAVRMGRAGAKLGQIGRGLSTTARVGEEVASAGRFGKALLGSEKVAEGLAGYKGFVYKALDNAVTTGKLSKTTANVLAKTGEVLNTTRFIGTSSGNEAGIEAFHFKKEATENFYRDFEELNGRQPTAEESAEMLEKIEGAANNVFASNMAILGVSNLAMLGNMFKLKSPISSLQKSVNQKLFGIGTKQVAGETGELIFKGIERKAWQKGAGLLYKATSPIVREGLFEEGLQGVTTKTANNWIERQYDPKYLNKVMSLSDDAWKAMGEQYGTKEGWKEIGIGGIVGILGGGFTGEFSKFSRMAEEQEKIVAKGLNAANVTMKTFVSDINAGRMMTMAKVMEAEDRAEQAMTKRDVVGVKLAQNDSMIALAEMYNNPLYGAGGLSQMEKHGYNMIDTTETTEQEKEELKAGFKSFIGEYKSANNFANSIVGNQGRIYGTEFQASDVQKALTYTILQGQSSKKMMDESLDSLQSYMNSELIDAVKRNDDLGALGADKKRQVKNLSQQYRNWEKKSEQVQKTVRLLQASPNEVEGDKKSRLVEMQQKLIDIESSKQEIRAELEVIGREVAQNRKMQQSFGQDVSNIPMVEDFIAVDDLINLDNKLDELEQSYKLLNNVNPTSAQAVKENMDTYKKAQQSLLDHNSAIKLIASGNFKPQLADTNPFSGIYKKLSKGEEKADEHTSQFLTRLNEIRDSYKTSVIKEGQEKDVLSYQKEIDTLKSKKILTEEDTAKIADLESKIQALQPTVQTQTANDDTPSKESIIVKKLEELTNKVNTLEAELKKTPQTVTAEQNIVYNQSEIEANTEKRRQEELDANSGKSKLLETPTQDKQEALNKGKEVLDENEELIKQLEKEFTNEDETLFNELDEKLTNLLASKTKGEVSFSFENGKIELTVSEVQHGDTINSNYKGTREGQIGKYKIGDNVQVSNGSVAISGKVTKVSSTGRIIEAKNDKGTVLIRNGVVLSSNTIQKDKEINVKYDTELKLLEEQTTQTEEQLNPRIKEIQKEISNLKREINKLNPQIELSPVEVLKARIEDILKLFKTSFVGTYDVDEAVKNRPDQKDIERYRELKQDSLIKEYEVSGQLPIDTNMVDEFEALKEKLSQWRVYDSLAEDEQSVADLLDIVAQLETEVEQENTVTEPNVEDTFEDLKPTATVDILELSVNTNYPVTIKREKNGSYNITHMNPSSLLQRMGAINVKIGKKEVSFQEVDNQKKQGLTVDFTSGGVAMKFTIADRGRINISDKDFKAIPNVKTIETLSSWTYPTLYEQDFEGNWKPISSDFSDPNITGDSNNLKDEDALELFVDVNNEYNQKLLKDKVKDEELENQVVIYIRKGGENYGTIKGLTIDNRNDLLGSETSILTLRKLAAEALKQGNSGVVATTQVKYVQLGNPILNIDGNGHISQIAISDLGLRNIEATGFVQDGEITLNKEIKDVRKSFIRKVSEKNKGKKVPIVVIKRGAQMIAFPVQMVKTNVSKIEDLNFILDNVEITDAQKVTSINNLLIENGIAPKEFELTTLDEQKVNAIADRLDKNQEYKTAEQLADKSYKKENLINDATIALDLENLSVSLPSQKFNVDLENLDYDNLPDLKVEKQAVLEKEAEKEVETPKVISAKKQVNKPKTAIEKEELDTSEALTDENGKPIKLYHGSENKIKGDFINKNPNIKGFFFSTDKENAKTYGENIEEVYLKIKNPLIINAEGLKFTDDIPVKVIAKYPNEQPYETTIELGLDEIVYMVKEGKRKNSFIEIPNRENYDGVIFKNIIDPSLSSRREISQDTVVAFTNEQIIRANKSSMKVADVEEIAKTIVEKIKEQPIVQTEEIIVMEDKQPQINLVSFETVDFTGTPTTFYRKGNKWGYLNSNGMFDSLIPNAQAQIEQEYQAKKESEKAEKDSQC